MPLAASERGDVYGDKERLPRSEPDLRLVHDWFRPITTPPLVAGYVLFVGSRCTLCQLKEADLQVTIHKTIIEHKFWTPVTTPCGPVRVARRVPR